MATTYVNQSDVDNKLTDEPQGLDASIENLSFAYGNNEVLKSINLKIRPGTITGLFGRNGVGKTTLLSIIAGQIKAKKGVVKVGGEEVWENPNRTSRMLLMKDKGGLFSADKIKYNVLAYQAHQPNFDKAYAYHLLEKFEVPLKVLPQKLSTGQLSALKASLVLASRAELTMLDEVYLGMDAVARGIFYQEILDDYVRAPRTFILSSHLLDEVQDLLEDVIVLHNGSVVEQGSADEVRQKYSANGQLASMTDVLVGVSSTGGVQ